MKSILLVSYVLLLAITAARGKSADEWKSRVIYQVHAIVYSTSYDVATCVHGL